LTILDQRKLAIEAEVSVRLDVDGPNYEVGKPRLFNLRDTRLSLFINWATSKEGGDALHLGRSRGGGAACGRRLRGGTATGDQ